MQKQSEHFTHATDRIRLETSRIHGTCGIRHPQVLQSQLRARAEQWAAKTSLHFYKSLGNSPTILVGMTSDDSHPSSSTVRLHLQKQTQFGDSAMPNSFES
jgi:hypothetical protein